MQTRKVRVIKQSDPLNNGGERDYVRDHEKSLIALLVPQHVEYARQVVEKAERRSAGRITQEVVQSADF